MVYRGRTEGMNQWKSAHAVETKARTLAEAMAGSDVFLGLSAKGALTPDMVKLAWRQGPIIFAMANPDPEITPEEAKAVRHDVIVATGRSDYPNQVNNVLGFPYIFRGALDVRATTINEEMKIAAAQAIAALAREDVPDEVAAAYRGARPVYGPEYIIPSPFDPRLISRVSARRGGSRDEIGRGQEADRGSERLSVPACRRGWIPPPACSRWSPMRCAPSPSGWCSPKAKRNSVIRAAAAFQNSGMGKALLVGRPDVVKQGLKRAGFDENLIEIRVPHSAQEATALYRCALQAHPAPRRASPRCGAHGHQRPQHLCRLDAQGRRRRRHGDGRDPQLCQCAGRRPRWCWTRRRASAPWACR